MARETGTSAGELRMASRIALGESPFRLDSSRLQLLDDMRVSIGSNTSKFNALKRSIFIPFQPLPETFIRFARYCTVSAAASRRHVDASWICLQEKAHVAGEIYQRRALSARRPFFLWMVGV